MNSTTISPTAIKNHGEVKIPLMASVVYKIGLTPTLSFDTRLICVNGSSL